MFTAHRVAAYAAFMLTAAACGPSIEARTMVSPDAGLSTLHTFRMLAGPVRRDGRPVTGDDDPMISNSIANRALREQLVQAFQGRGYTVDDQHPDFGVAFYAGAREKVDLTMWDYGYPYTPGWPPLRGAAHTAVPYTEGVVIVDVVRTSTHALLWRGMGTAVLEGDPTQNVNQLKKAAEAIVGKFPRATTPIVAAR